MGEKREREGERGMDRKRERRANGERYLSTKEISRMRQRVGSVIEGAEKQKEAC